MVDKLKWVDVTNAEPCPEICISTAHSSWAALWCTTTHVVSGENIPRTIQRVLCFARPVSHLKCVFVENEWEQPSHEPDKRHDLKQQLNAMLSFQAC